MGNMGLKSMRFVPTNGKCESSHISFLHSQGTKTHQGTEAVSVLYQSLYHLNHSGQKKLKFGERWNSNGPAKPHPWSITVEIWANGIQWLRASRTTQAQSNYDWLSHQRACHSNGGRNTFIIALRMNMQQLRTRRSLSGGVSCWKQKVRVTMTCCLINGLALVAEEQTHHSFQYQHATTLPKQYSSESCRTTQAQSNYDWLSHQRACHSNGGRKYFHHRSQNEHATIADKTVTQWGSVVLKTKGQSNYDLLSHQWACLSSRRTNSS